MASLSCVAFWKTDAEAAISPLPFVGGPRGGNSGCWSVGVTTFDAPFELLPARRPEEVLEPELRDLSRYAPVLVRLTMRLEERVSCVAVVGVALVKVRV